MGKVHASSATQEVQLARWYEFFLDVVKRAKWMKYGVATNPAHKSEIMDMMERVLEDELYPWDELPELLVDSRVPVGEYKLVDPKTLKLLAMSDVYKSNIGLGRFKKLWTPYGALDRME